MGGGGRVGVKSTERDCGSRNELLSGFCLCGNLFLFFPTMGEKITNRCKLFSWVYHCHLHLMSRRGFIENVAEV